MSGAGCRSDLWQPELRLAAVKYVIALGGGLSSFQAQDGSVGLSITDFNVLVKDCRCIKVSLNNEDHLLWGSSAEAIYSGAHGKRLLHKAVIKQLILEASELPISSEGTPAPKRRRCRKTTRANLVSEINELELELTTKKEELAAWDDVEFTQQTMHPQQWVAGDGHTPVVDEAAGYDILTFLIGSSASLCDKLDFHCRILLSFPLPLALLWNNEPGALSALGNLSGAIISLPFAFMTLPFLLRICPLPSYMFSVWFSFFNSGDHTLVL